MCSVTFASASATNVCLHGMKRYGYFIITSICNVWTVNWHNENKKIFWIFFAQQYSFGHILLGKTWLMELRKRGQQTETRWKTTGCLRRSCLHVLWPWPLTTKSNQYIYKPEYICDQNWVKFPSLVFEIRCSQVFATHRLTHSLTHRWTNPITECLLLCFSMVASA